MKILIALPNDPNGRICVAKIRAYRPADLAKVRAWAERENLKIVNDDAKLADLKPYEMVNFTGAAFTDSGVLVAKFHDGYALHRVEA